jgi:nitroreductase
MDDQDLATVLDCAQLAPSVHNTQPWTFVVDGDTIAVRADRDRGLAVLDPTSRELAISCGAAIELAAIAVRGLGWQCTTRVLPDATDPDLLARLELGARRSPTAVDRELYDAIPRRYTDRGSYEPADLRPAALDVLRRGVGERGAWLKILDHDGDRLAVIQALSNAEAAEASDPAYAAELTGWMRLGPAADGIPPAALRRTGPGQAVSDVPLRDFSGRDEHPRPGDVAPAPPVERDLLLMIGTETDDPHSWVQAGRALGWLLLSLTSHGLSSQPLGPAIDLERTRYSLGRQLNLVGQAQFLLRVGVGHGAPTTGRRRVSEASA